MNIVNRSRTAFHCQPAQHLLIDVGYPMTPGILKCVTEAVENVLSLASSMYGGVRVPEFGVSFINREYYNVLPILKVRGNYPKIAKSFKSLQDMVKSNEKNTFQEFTDYLKLAIHNILEEFTSKKNQACMREKLTSQFVLITLITLRDGLELQIFLEEILNSLSIAKLKKICVLQIVESTRSAIKIGTLVDYTLLELNKFKLEQFFKQWLLDCDASQEHICLHLISNDRNKSNITIKCDIDDSMINPFLLPFGHFYQIQTDYFKGSGVIKFPAKHIPVYNLIITSRISGSGVCESLLFGQPHRLSPTKCWQMEGNDSLTNQQHFYSLCKQLLEKNEYLLAISTHSEEENIKVSSHFILIPGTHTLLLRAVTPSELVLPNRKVEVMQPDEILTKRITDNMDFAFSNLPIIEDFMPDAVSSNLYHILKSNFIQKIEIQEDLVKSSNVDHPALDNQRTKLCLDKKRRLL